VNQAEEEHRGRTSAGVLANGGLNNRKPSHVPGKTPADFRKSRGGTQKQVNQTEEVYRGRTGTGVLVNDELNNKEPPHVTGKALADFRKSQEGAQKQVNQAEEVHRGRMGAGALAKGGRNNNKPPLITGKTLADSRKSQEGAQKQVNQAEEEHRGRAGAGVLTKDGLNNNKPPLVTGKTPQEELDALRSLVNSTVLLEQYGYSLEPPTASQIKGAEEGVAAAAGWEACDRCGTNFKVFKGGRQDGRFTSGGECNFHRGKMAPLPSMLYSLTFGKPSLIEERISICL
jgi:hypothetical protein